VLRSAETKPLFCDLFFPPRNGKVANMNKKVVKSCWFECGDKDPKSHQKFRFDHKSNLYIYNSTSLFFERNGKVDNKNENLINIFVIMS